MAMRVEPGRSIESDCHVTQKAVCLTLHQAGRLGPQAQKRFSLKTDTTNGILGLNQQTSWATVTEGIRYVFFSFFFLLYLYEKMDVSGTYFTIYVIQTIMLYALNLIYANYFSIKLEKIYFYLVNWKGDKANFNKSQINKNK